MDTLTAEDIQSHSSPPFGGGGDSQETKFKCPAENGEAPNDPWVPIAIIRQTSYTYKDYGLGKKCQASGDKDD
jgi:hypothetical protein